MVFVLDNLQASSAGLLLYSDDNPCRKTCLSSCFLRNPYNNNIFYYIQVNSVGIWFTGVDFNVDALYQDQSKTNMASHRLKVLINSNHFKNIAADGRFTQDNRQITFIGQVLYRILHCIYTYIAKKILFTFV